MKNYAQAMNQIVKTQALVKPTFYVGKVTERGTERSFGIVTSVDGKDVLYPQYGTLGSWVVFEVFLEGGRFERAFNVQTKQELLSSINYYRRHRKGNQELLAQLVAKYKILSQYDKSEIRSSDLDTLKYLESLN